MTRSRLRDIGPQLVTLMFNILRMFSRYGDLLPKAEDPRCGGTGGHAEVAADALGFDRAIAVASGVVELNCIFRSSVSETLLLPENPQFCGKFLVPRLWARYAGRDALPGIAVEPSDELLVDDAADIVYRSRLVQAG